jgi:formate hydrogenlyase subunit 6/NADH:ubiquinone oxidoreductase subunit I
MSTLALHLHDRVVVERDHLSEVMAYLSSKGYQVIGPTVREQAIIYDTLSSLDDLPVGYTDEQDGGSYRLKPRRDRALFGYAVGPQSWKKFLHPPSVRLWQAYRTDTGFRIAEDQQETPKFAFIGVRSCELHAIAIQDRVFLQHNDPIYRERRAHLCIIAVNCAQAGGTCFCVSMQTGPKAESGFDLALTEILDEQQHYFVVEVGSELGIEILNAVPYREANQDDIERAENVLANTAAQMGRSMDTTDIKNLLYRNLDHPRWENVASRCLSCTNCTMVCPTCFCTTVEDMTDLAGTRAERWRRWDSCFTMDFSYIVGGSVRSSTKARYRQWMTHKLASWIDQFGTSGCVGCGRCITWCPVGIDITEEVRAIRETPMSSPADL